jgi:hypothetical protein
MLGVGYIDVQSKRLKSAVSAKAIVESKETKVTIPKVGDLLHLSIYRVDTLKWPSSVCD